MKFIKYALLAFSLLATPVVAQDITGPPFTGNIGAATGSTLNLNSCSSGGRLCVNGNIFVQSGQITFPNGTSLTVPGSIGTQATDGLAFWCKTGSLYDCEMYDAAGNSMWRVPTGTNTMVFIGNIVPRVTTVGALGSAATVGARATVTDAVACTFASTPTGGGSVVCPVMSNGSAWVAG